jgi:antitoxin component YwqK of YwqJK toxin-antitoxin module
MRSLVVTLALIAIPGTPAGELRRSQPVVERTTFYAGGTIASRGFFDGDRKVGLHKTWWPSGTLRSWTNYAGGVFHGEYRTWRENGHPYELRHFDRGRESGLQQSWNDDGTPYLNYEVRNGRRYGLINAVPCLPAGNAGTSMMVEP